MNSPDQNLTSTTLFTEGGAFIKLEAHNHLILKLSDQEIKSRADYGDESENPQQAETLIASSTKLDLQVFKSMMGDIENIDPDRPPISLSDVRKLNNLQKSKAQK
jgi:hypothetical protein